MKKYGQLIATLSLFLLLGCGSSGDSKHGETTPSPENADLSNTFAYESSSQYKSVLTSCASAKKESESCSLEKLPFLAQESAVPSKEMIMKRVVVSHEWMGRRFAEMLDLLDDDIKILLGAVTAIVIDDDIIPSYYWALTGAMYLDPRYLYLTQEELATIKEKEDYRSSFSNNLKFLETRRSLINGADATPINATRTKESIKLKLASLLYHELAHANDYYPPYLRTEVNPSNTIYENLSSISSRNVSHALYEEYPLSSDELYKMGQVMYRGKTATAEQKSTTATQMGTLFSHDNASTMYAYSSVFEDTATLFQNAMMKLHYNVEVDFAFLNRPTKTGTLDCPDYIVGWGERNTVAKEGVKRRAIFVAKKFFPTKTDLEEKLNNQLGSAQLLPTQIDWCSAINIEDSSNKQFKNHKEKINPDDFKMLAL